MIFENAVINGGMSLNDYNIKDVTTNVRNVDKVYDLSIAEEFAEFGEKVKGGEHFAVAVILCVFEYRSEERRVGKECRSRWSPYH